jgi:Lon-like ATP-dependent protease
VAQNIKEGLDGCPAAWYSDVQELVFPNIDEEKASKCVACEIKSKEKAEKKRSKSKSREDDDSD